MTPAELTQYLEGWERFSATIPQGAPRTPYRVSVSQVSRFKGCNAKWYLEKVLGFKIPQHASAALGSELHTCQENYLRHGTPHPATRAGRLAALGVHYLPAPQSPNVTIEHEFWRFDTALPFNGKIDLIERPAHHANGHRFVIIRDHKTTGNPTYALTDTDLVTDMQLASYALHTMETDSVEWALVSHVYYLTKGSPRSWKVEAWLDKSSALRQWQDIKDTVAQMVEVAKLPEADVTHDYSHCSAYGGCFFRSRCHKQGKSVIDTAFAVEAARNTTGPRERFRCQ